MSTQIIPRCPISIRPATITDLPFMDRLQKQYGKALGYFPTKQFEGYVEMGGVLIAEERHEGTEAQRHEVVEEGKEGESEFTDPSSLVPHSMPSSLRASVPVGYVISRDRYLKRDELGVIYQLCVECGVQRKLVGAMLVREVFERSAYGCKLYCCWCAQDLDANYFWESLGFVPIAFRAGSTGKKRVHIFWQRRIGVDDCVTPYWYPFQTSSGAIREDRLVFPIPPGVHWKDVQAVVVPGMDRVSGIGCRGSGEKQRRLPSSSSRTPKPEPRNPNKVAILVGGRIKYIDRPGYVAPQAIGEPAPKKVRPKRTAAKACPERSRRIDPKYLTAARELRDRYLEQFNSGMILPAGKYDVCRVLPEPPYRSPIPALPVAA